MKLEERIKLAADQAAVFIAENLAENHHDKRMALRAKAGMALIALAAEKSASIEQQIEELAQLADILVTYIENLSDLREKMAKEGKDEEDLYRVDLTEQDLKDIEDLLKGEDL